LYRSIALFLHFTLLLQDSYLIVEPLTKSARRPQRHHGVKMEFSRLHMRGFREGLQAALGMCYAEGLVEPPKDF